MVYGTYQLLDPDNEKLYVYTRTLDNEKLLVICNFTEEEEIYSVPEEFSEGEVLISNYHRETVEKEILLKPYEALVLKIS